MDIDATLSDLRSPTKNEINVDRVKVKCYILCTCYTSVSEVKLNEMDNTFQTMLQMGRDAKAEA